jgi:hypothetical protein
MVPNSKMPRQRHRLTLGEKAIIIKKYHENPLWSLTKLRSWFVEELKLCKTPAFSTIKLMLKQQKQILQLDSAYLQSNPKSMRKVKIQELEKRLWDWFQKRESNGILVSEPAIQEKAESILQDIGSVGVLKLSSGWLTSFKKRHGLRSFT